VETDLTWKQRFQKRVNTVEWLIKLKSDDPTSDVEVWRWLLKLLLHLRSDGMSSDDTTKGDETVFRVRILIWRREEIDGLMELIDKQQVKNRQIRTPQGAKAVPRLRNARAPFSTRRHVDGLPESVYSAEWKAARGHEVLLNVSREQFQWVQVMTH
jgi:hypothetical protein